MSKVEEQNNSNFSHSYMILRSKISFRRVDLQVSVAPEQDAYSDYHSTQFSQWYSFLMHQLYFVNKCCLILKHLLQYLSQRHYGQGQCSNYHQNTFVSSYLSIIIMIYFENNLAQLHIFIKLTSFNQKIYFFESAKKQNHDQNIAFISEMSLF